MKRHLLLEYILMLIATSITSITYANPVLNNIGAGNVTVSQTPDTTVVNQSSQKAILNWNSFNINATQSTHFQQPAGGVTLNRISATQGASQIYGKLSSTGQIILVNPAGIFFGPGAHVNVGSLIATTADIHDSDFLAGSYKFSIPSSNSGAIINEGQIIAHNNGLIALVAPGVINKGMIKANLGRVILGSGETFTLNFSGDNLINFSINKPTSHRAKDRNGNELPDGVKNTGSILADGGKIIISAHAARGVLDHAINMSGVTQARSVSNSNGVIIFNAAPHSGKIKIAGRINARGKNSERNGGNVTIVGDDISIESQAQINVSGKNGGDITLDSGLEGTTLVAGVLKAKGHSGTGGTITVLGQNVGLVDNALLNASGTLGGGNVFIGGSAYGSGPFHNADYTFMGSNAAIYADALTTGKGGTVILWSDHLTVFAGNIFARGGIAGGDGGWVETSGKINLNASGKVHANALSPSNAAGTWLLDPSDVTISAAANNNGSFTGAATITFAPTAAATTSNAQASGGTSVDSIQEALNAGTNVVINTTSSSGNPGNITILDPITKTAGGNAILTLNAGGGSTATLNALISINSPITATVGQLTINMTTGTGGVSFGANVNTNGGNIVINSGGPIAQTAGALTVGTLQVTAASGGIVLNQAGNSITNFSATNNVSGNIIINNARAAGFNINGAVINNVAGGAITLVNTAGALTTSAAVSSRPGGVQLAAGGGTITLTAGNGVLTTSGNTLTTGNMIFNGSNGVTINSAVIQVVGGLGVGNSTTPGASITINANNSFNLAAGGIFTGTTSAGAGDIVINADLVNIAAQLGGTAATFGLARSIFINPLTAGTTIGFGGAGTGGTLSLTSGELNLMWVGGVKIGNATAGNITVNAYSKGAFGFVDGPSVLTLQTAGTIIGGPLNLSLNDTLDFSRVQMIAGGDINVTFSPTFAGRVNQTVAAISTSGSVQLSSMVSGRTINPISVTNLFGQTTNGISVSGANTISINNAVGSLGGIIIDAGLSTGSGTIDLHSSAGNAITINNGNISTSGNVTMSGTTVSTGSVTQPGSGIIIANTLTTTTVGGLSLTKQNQINNYSGNNSGTGNLAFTSSLPLTVTGIINSANAGSIDIQNTGALAINGNITSTNGNISLNTTSGGYTQANLVAINAGSGTISIGAGGGSAIFNTGTLTSTNNTTSAITIFNAGTTSLGNISAINGGLQLGIGGAITGAISQANGSITANSLSLLNTSASTNLTQAANNIAVLGSINASGQTFNLTSIANGITQSAAMSAAAFGLVPSGVGNIVLSQNNSLGDFHVTTNNNVSLVNIVPINLSSSTIGGTFNLTNTGAISNNGPLNISGLATIFGNSNVSLTNASNDFSTINAAGTNISIVDVNNLILGTMTPSASLTVNALNTLTANNPISGVFNLAFTAASILLNSGSINTTTGTQTYSGPVILGVDTSLSGSSIVFNNGISGNRQLNLVGSMLVLNGNLSLTTLNATGNSGSNFLRLNNSSDQQFVLTAASAGNLLVGNIAGSFNNIQSIGAGSGTNKLTGNNVMNTWNLTGLNAGSVLNSLTFSNIQTLIGGDSGNTFNFINDSAAFTGSINGGGLIASNTFNFTGRSGVNVQLVTSIFNGNVLTSNNSHLVTYSNVGTLIGNAAYSNKLIMPTNKSNQVVVTSLRTGYVNDPLYFINFDTIQSLTGHDSVTFTTQPSVVNAAGPYVIIDGQFMFFPGFDLSQIVSPNIPSIIVQPNHLTFYPTTKSSAANSDGFIVNEIITAYQAYLRSIRIDPYCSASGGV